MSTKTKLFFIFFLPALLGFVAPVFAQEPLVYSRCERTTATYQLTGNVIVNGQSQSVTRTMTGLDVYDVLPDVTNFFGDFSAPCDLVYRDANGVETVIFNCSATSTNQNACAALDPAVSFDGKIIAFAVFRGSLVNHQEWNVDSRVLHPDAEPANLGSKTLPNKRLQTTGAHLHFYTIATGKTLAIPFTPGVYDSGPAFISNSRVAFTSTRDGHTSTLVFHSTGSKEGTRIWAVDIDGRNPDLSSHHALSQEQHPFMLKNGRLAYSSWQIFGGLPFRHPNGSAGGFTTVDNMFHIYAQDPDGARNFPIFGQHIPVATTSSFGSNHDAAHFITQTSDERIWFADYYRGNNNGLGAVIGVMAEPEGQEGFGPTEVTNHADLFVPRDTINFAAWSNNADRMAKPMVSPAITHPAYADPIPFAGKVGHPAALPGNALMLVWGKGACSTVARSDVFQMLGKAIPPMTNGNGNGVAMNVITSLNMDTPGCDTGIYRATRIPSQHPSDLEMIVDSPDWHEIMARAVVPYSAIHGVDHPEVVARSDLRAAHATLVTGTPFGLLGAASITDRETHPIDDIHFQGEKQFNLQGTDTIDYTDEELCGVRILGIMPNRSANTYHEIANYAGERVAILGEFPVLNRNASGNRVIDPSGHPDTSFLVRMPANTPYLMQGVDCNGRTLNTDQTWQSLRPGEQKTCGGCHVHSKPTRITFAQSFAATPAYVIPRLGEGTVPLLAGKSGETVQTRTVSGYGMRIEFTRDIKPIFDQRCITCHGGGSPAAGLDLSLTNVANNNVAGTTWHTLIADRSDKFRRPQLTRYVRAFNSRGSLLYWKAANQRTDNRTDGQYADDIDFGAAHPTSITPDELGLLSRWIDIGAPGGAQELKDTQKPTLHLAIADNSGSLSQLRVGTVDLGSGIDPGSLRVCVRGSDGACSNRAGAAEKHGVTLVDLGASLSDPNTEIYASVRDLAGNTTEVYRSVGWFLNSGSVNIGNTGTDTQAPKISITSPLSGAVSGVVPVAFSYSDNTAVVSVDFYVNGALHSTSAQAPFALSLDATKLVSGSYTLSAIAFDAERNQGVSNSVIVTVNNGSTTNDSDTQPPVISIASPIAGSTVSGNIPVSFSYADNVAVTAVDLYLNGQPYGKNMQAPFTFALDSTKLTNGTHTLAAHAFDAAGNKGVSASVSIAVSNTVIDTQAPVISIASPLTGSTVSGILPVSFNFTGAATIKYVDLFINNIPYSRKSVAPFTHTLNTGILPDGNYVLSAHAIDAAGNHNVSANVSITINNTSPADTQKPTISIASPISGSTVSGSIPVSFSYADNVAVTAVDLYVNGQLHGKNTQAPFAFTLDTAKIPNGSYSLVAHASDAAGNQGISAAASVTVNNAPAADTQKPVISIASPAAGSTVSGVLSISFNFADIATIKYVDLFVNGIPYNRKSTAPFTHTLNTGLLPDGDHTLTAYAVDAANNRSVSANLIVKVKNRL
ncbi:MAG: hypothetical protein H6939_09955 [Burkholderiales bacterium]|nr:hypothetical protein [Burkholderiales bacterium]